MAYCGNVKVSVLDSMLIHQDVKSWELSATECEGRGGSLLTVFTKDWEDILFTNFGSSGNGKYFWSIFKFENGSFYAHGIPHYNVTDLTQIPWLSPIQSSWYKDDDCVYQRISELGVRYGVAICDPKWGNKASICQLVDYSFYYQSNKDNVGKIPLIEHNLVLNDMACYLKCQYNEKCRSISYYPNTLTCKLYSTIDPGINNDSPNKHMYREECRLPSNPLSGSLTSLPSVTPVGTTVDYTCDTGFKVPDLYDDFLTCSSSGTWSNVPKCVFDGLQCDQGWEQETTSCYRVIEKKVPWLTAVTVCLNNGATLIEVYSKEEMDFIKTLLDHNSNELYWSGGNCRIMNGYYSWSSNPYSQWTYTRWAPDLEPSGAGQCVALKRKFEVLNVGSLNCSRFGADPCKQNSECIDEKCICKPFFYQLGLDDVTSTECLPIQPVGRGPCYDMAEFCMNNSTCISDICTCPSGWYQNGMSGSLSAICQTSPVSCPVSWVQHDGHCYFMDEKNYMGSSIVTEDSDPAVHCGALKAYMAVIPDAATNEVIRQLGLGPSYRFIGLVDEFRTEDYVWLGEESSLTYTNFEFDNTSAQIGVIMNPIGYWVKTSYVKSLPSILTPAIPKDKIVCEKPHLCSPIPPVSNAIVPPVAAVGEHVGKEYLYACDTGYVLGGLSYPFIKCRETNRVSLWDSIPQCISLLAEKYIDVSDTTVKGTLITSSVETTNQMCAVQCYEETLCEAFYYSPTTKECILYDLQSQLYTIATGAEIWKTAVCDPIPYVKHAVIKVTGRSFGDKVTYECPSNRRIARNTSATLTCLPTGRWDKEPPYCEGRFERQPDAIYKVGTTSKQKMYHNIFTVDDCEVKCTEETRFRCMLSVYRQGTCHLWSKLPISEASNAKHLLFLSGAYSSSLQDADVDMYFKTDEKIITSDIGVTYTNVSYEICAQKCGLDENNCTVFDYRGGIGTCIIHTIPDINTITYAADVDFEVYTRLFGMY
ncbi:uncharacterized protein LOC143046831 [Mytilus galloprovincialis]|uniref:uncharacterized protein LOC143046831 n=1 Tax=Mytilus galloprovincialis TaxID=29158 RepID=UPI003F7BE473